MTHQHRTLITAADLETKHIGRHVRVGAVEGQLRAVFGLRDRVELEVEVGGAKAIFMLRGGECVEVWKP